MGQHNFKHPHNFKGSGAPSDGGHDYFAGRRQPQAAMAVSTLLVCRVRWKFEYNSNKHYRLIILRLS